MMRVVIAPDKFKGSLTAISAYGAIANGVWAARPKTKLSLFAMADGGEGTADVFRMNGCRRVTREVCGPLPGTRVSGEIVFLEDGETAILDMATAAGYSLLGDGERDPTRTTTYGVGELIRFAADAGVRKIVVGLGGSATCDGGLGAAQALGAAVELDDGPATSPVTGADLSRLRGIAFPGRLTNPKAPLSREQSERPGSESDARSARGSTGSSARATEQTDGVEVICLCDVDNPLSGSRGAARVFAPQKGATPAQVEQLDIGLRRLTDVADARDLANEPGTGAAGGLAFGLALACGATRRPGADYVADALGLDSRLDGADLCITGEGRFDATSLGGKVTACVARRCKRFGVPCFVLAGGVELDLEEAHAAGVTSYRGIVPGPCTLDEAEANAFDWLGRAAEQSVRLFLAGRV